MITSDTPIVMLTVGQLMELVEEQVSYTIAHQPDNKDPYGEVVWGNKALAKFLGLSQKQASVNASAGKYKGAVIKDGRRVGFYPKKLKELLANQ